MIRYISDPHFFHANIIRYCNRPFADVPTMNARLFAAFQEADQSGAEIVCCGDVAFRMTEVVDAFGNLEGANRHTLVFGNHDRTSHRAAYLRWFGRLIGTHRTWENNAWVVNDLLAGRPIKVLVSHAPQTDLRGCDLNVYGHVHDRWEPHPSHLCACVEATGYRALSLDDLYIQTKLFSSDEILPEYDFSRGIRGKYAR